MAFNDLHYIQELKEQFFQKIIDDWDNKWKHFPTIENDNFESLPNLTAFIEELYDDIDNTLKPKLSLIERSEMMISKENLRRILKNHRKIRLQTHTRNCLAYYLGYDGWQDFTEKITPTLLQEPVVVNYVQVYQSLLPQRYQTFRLPQDEVYIIEEKQPFWKKLNFKKASFFLLGCFMVISSAFYIHQWYKNRPFTPEQLTKVKFEIISRAGKFAPQTFIIHYDISSLNTLDSVMIDFNELQSQNFNFIKGDMQFRKITEKAGNIEYAIYRPGHRLIRLLVRGRVIKTIPIIISSNGWAGNVINTEYISPSILEKNMIKNGILHYPTELIIDSKVKQYYFTGMSMVKDFGITGDSATLEVKLKNPFSEGGISCFNTSCLFETFQFDNVENDSPVSSDFSYLIAREGCPGYYSVDREIVGWYDSKMAKLINGLETNMEEWHILKIENKRGITNFYKDGILVYSKTYRKKLSNVDILSLTFKGSGSADYVKLSNSYTNKVIFYDDFER